MKLKYLKMLLLVVIIPILYEQQRKQKANTAEPVIQNRH